MASKTAISGEEGLRDFLELFNTINAMADGELGFIVGYAVDQGNPFYDIKDYHISSSVNLLVEIMNDSELANAVEKFGAVVDKFNQQDKLDAIYDSGAYKQFCKIFEEQGVGLVMNYLNYVEEAGLPKEMPDWEGGEEVLALYNRLVAKYNA
jgi:hypothetical protein